MHRRILGIPGTGAGWINPVVSDYSWTESDRVKGWNTQSSRPMLGFPSVHSKSNFDNLVREITHEVGDDITEQPTSSYLGCFSLIRRSILILISLYMVF